MGTTLPQKKKKKNPRKEKERQIYCFIYYFMMALGFELRASQLQSRHSTPKATLPVHFALVILEMGSHELFTCAGLNCDLPDLSLLSS
jgi:hypothetical protein